MTHSPGEGRGGPLGGGVDPQRGIHMVPHSFVHFQQNPNVTVCSRFGKWAYVLDALILDKPVLMMT